jgi:hypothetical protein
MTALSKPVPPERPPIMEFLGERPAPPSPRYPNVALGRLLPNGLTVDGTIPSGVRLQQRSVLAITTFDLSLPADLLALNELMVLTNTGHRTINRFQQQYDEKTGSWKVLVGYAINFYEAKQ